MERENFYLLLELALDPPETDTQVIEQAIRIKQSQWSRLRNHPTKALEAKQRIGMLSGIRAIMLNPVLRVQEAQAAIALIRKREVERYGRIDRHIGMYFSKGPVTDEEVAKLTILHGLSEKEVRNRIRALEAKKFTISDYLARNQKVVKTLPDNEKIADIHKNLLIRMVKGYITQYEIEKLSIFYDYPATEIQKLVTVPVWEANKKGPVDTVSTLDKSIEKNISTNLRIVGKFSLYEFLNVVPSSALAAIQASAQQKRKETQAAGAKSAEVTAAGALAGYCISIFNSEADRKSYDMALARQILSTFHSDISMAVIQNEIRSEYFDVLLRFAMDYALDEDDAIRFIEDFCRHHGWKIKSRRKNFRRLALIAAVLGVVALLTFGTISIIKAVKYNHMKTEYNLLVNRTDRMIRLEDKRNALQNYINAQDQQSDFTDEAAIRLKKIEEKIKKQQAIEEQFYREIVVQAETLRNENKFGEAQRLYQDYLKKYPDGRYVTEAREYSTTLAGLMESYDFQLLQSIPEDNASARIKAYKTYLAGYPNSEHRLEVQGQLDALSVTYGQKMLQEVSSAEARQDWDVSIRLCKEYLENFESGDLSPKFRGLLTFYEEQQKSRKP